MFLKQNKTQINLKMLQNLGFFLVEGILSRLFILVLCYCDAIKFVEF
jgi:hypothetical protein